MVVVEGDDKVVAVVAGGGGDGGGRMLRGDGQRERPDDAVCVCGVEATQIQVAVLIIIKMPRCSLQNDVKGGEERCNSGVSLHWKPNVGPLTQFLPTSAVPS